jgi:hypothetical protein
MFAKRERVRGGEWRRARVTIIAMKEAGGDIVSYPAFERGMDEGGGGTEEANKNRCSNADANDMVLRGLFSLAGGRHIS